jgi:hypothetical protein
MCARSTSIKETRVKVSAPPPAKDERCFKHGLWLCSTCGKGKLTPTQQAIQEECQALATLLIEKNRAYGDSAISPIRIFSKADSEEQIKVRLDDKLSRLARGSAAGEDVELDLMGYLVLLRVARKLGGGK